MSRSRRILLAGGIALAMFGMVYGMWYAIFAEHQALEEIGVSLLTAFSGAAQRDPAQSEAALLRYKESKYVYDRQVDVHSHWIGLAMVLTVLGLCFNQVLFSEKLRIWIAVALLVGAWVFPLGVLLQAYGHGPLPRILAISGSVLEIASLSFVALGFARGQSPVSRS
jgi:uncharacterized membrane protein YpjA